MASLSGIGEGVGVGLSTWFLIRPRPGELQPVALRGEATFGGMALSKALPGVVSAEHRFAQRRLDYLTRWEPTTAEVGILRGLVNRRAGRELLYARYERPPRASSRAGQR